MMNVFFAVGFANAMHRLPRFGGVTEMPLFSDTIDHGSTSVDATHVEFTAHGRDRGFATGTPRKNQSQGLVTTHV